MKIIDILNKMANGELEDGFKFCFEDEVYTYTKEDNSIRDNCRNKIGQRKAIETHLNKEVLLFKENDVEVIEESEEIDIQGIKPFIIPRIAIADDKDMWTDRIMINKLIKSVKQLDNKLKKEREVN